MQVKRIKRNISGVLLLDKPLGYSSNQALQKVKWLFQAAKAGHTGTLDPLATGVLPICLGEATKFAQTITDADKTYIAEIQFGVTTTTGDAEGEVLQTKPVHFTQQQLEAVCQQMTGEIEQMPPMYSALKHEGKPLYEYARAGIEVPRKKRKVMIHKVAITAFEQPKARIQVTCSKGTYIRTLAEDIGSALGCGGHLTSLRRTETAGYTIEKTITIDDLETMTTAVRDALLLPVDTMLHALPKVILDADSAHFLLQGQAVWVAGKIPDSFLRLYDEDAHFLGMGMLDASGRVAPKRLIKKSD